MYRVLLSGVIASLLAGCGVTQPNIPLGFNGASAASVASSRSVAGASAATSDTKGAKAGSVKAGRDLAATQFDPSEARDLINAYRKTKGLKSLNLDPQLTLAAKAHAKDLAAHDRISHFGSDGSNPFDRVGRTGYRPKLAAENVGTGQMALSEVLEGWQKSESHNQNLLIPDATEFGIALVKAPDTRFKTFWTLVLAAKL